jgi:hypothetical protein
LGKKRINKLSLFLAFIMLFSLVSPSFALNTVSAATPTDLIISEYVEGSGSNKALELYNGTGQAINLKDYSLELYSNGSTSAIKLNLPDFSLSNGSTYVLVNGSAVATLKAKQNFSNSTVVNFSGDDAVVLKKGTVTIDSIGKIGERPTIGYWGTATVKTADQTLVRKSNITTGDKNTADAFDPAAEWESYPIDTFTNLGSHTMVVAPSKVSTVTSDVASGSIPAGASVSLSTSTPDASIYYTTNGDTPTIESTLHTQPIVINDNTTIKAVAYAPGFDPSDVATFEYQILDQTAPEAPTVNPVKDTDVKITGKAEYLSKVEVKVTDDLIATGTVIVPSGEFELGIPSYPAGTIISVTATDQAGNTSLTTEVTVTKTTVEKAVNITTDLASPQKVGSAIKLIGISSGLTEAEYRFFVKDSDGELTQLQEYGSSNTTTWTPTKTGTYTLIVHGKEKANTIGGLGYDVRGELTYKVIGGVVASVQVSSDLPAPHVIGKPITFKASSEGSIEPEYRFFVRENGNTTALHEFSSSDTVSWTPTKSGAYTIIVHAKDKSYTGTIPYEARTEMTYVVNGGKVTSVSVSANQAAPLVYGAPVTLQATSNGSLEPEYRFFVRENGVTTTLQEFSSNNTATWTPTKSGTYTIIVQAKDKSYPGAIIPYEARGEVTYNVIGGKVTSVQVSADTTSPVQIGSPITLKATSIGSQEPEYRFYVRDNSTTTMLQEFSSADSMIWTPNKSGTYTFIVQAKDKSYKGNIPYEARTEMTVVVNGGKVTSVTVTMDNAAEIGEVVTLTATSEGGLDPDYRFFVMKDGNLTTLQEYGNGNTATWTPTEPGVYKIIVHAKDKSQTSFGYYYEARTEILVPLLD